MTDDTPTPYTKADLEASIARLRALAPRAILYATVVQDDDPFWAAAGLGGWLTEYRRVDAAGRDLQPTADVGGTRAHSADEALQKAVAYNIDYIDQVEHPDWFDAGGRRKAEHPRAQSPALDD